MSISTYITNSGFEFGDAETGGSSHTIVIQEIEHVEQPMIIINTPSPYCNEDWSFRYFGTNWQCTCLESEMQSPINLPRREQLEIVVDQARFDYGIVKKENAQLVWEDNMIKIKGNFGSVTDIDMTEY